MNAARLLACLLIAAFAIAADARSSFFNQNVSARTVALNQPVRLELTTTPKQIEGVNIEAAVADAVTLGASQQWRLVGKPTAQIDEKTKTIRVSLVILPRAVGEAPLPTIPVAWINGDKVAEFGSVKVEPQLVIAGEIHPLPAELGNVAGFAWGAKLSELKDRLVTSGDAERTVVKPQPGLELIFRRGDLVEAAIDASDLTLEAARASFIARWGAPQIEEAGAVTWILGWTKITAAPSADGKGVRLSLSREDLVARLTRAKVADRVFGILESGALPVEAASPSASAPAGRSASAPAVR